MEISKINIKNFRLLNDVELSFEADSTVIVGRNNSGKTSITELFRRIFSEKNIHFNLEDFSLVSIKYFREAYDLFQKGGDILDVDKLIPKIEFQIEIQYKEGEDLSNLSPFIIDLNPSCTTVQVLISFSPQVGSIKSWFSAINPDFEKEPFTSQIQKTFKVYYSTVVTAIDPNDINNTKICDISELRLMIKAGFINAQRGLSDNTFTAKKDRVLGSILEKLFTNAEGSIELDEQQTIENITSAIGSVQETLDSAFKNELSKLLPTFDLFGYPGLADPQLSTSTILDAKSLVTGHTDVNYIGVEEITLPENYNGLGVRNLIFILLNLYEFFKSYKNSERSPSMHLVFIEEPEAHMHPQMQEVFIHQLREVAKVFEREFNNGEPWPVIFVVSTHSSHIVNKAPFNTIRYFLSKQCDDASTLRIAQIKDLNIMKKVLGDDDLKFLHQYLTLTKCDLFFSDKVIVIEGTSERLFLPKMIEKYDCANPNGTIAGQYISTIEVGGAYAYKFIPLLEFLELSTLIITDIDTVAVPSGATTKYKKKSLVSVGKTTSNATLKYWFKDILDKGEDSPTPKGLLGLTERELEEKLIKIVFQVPEDGDDKGCGRSLEEAFILANQDKFLVPTPSTIHEKEEYAEEKATEYKKTEFALKYTLVDDDWQTPKYINDGLSWLAVSGQQIDLTPDVLEELIDETDEESKK